VTRVFGPKALHPACLASSIALFVSFRGTAWIAGSASDPVSLAPRPNYSSRKMQCNISSPGRHNNSRAPSVSL
jgi:hypothetical protein